MDREVFVAYLNLMLVGSLRILESNRSKISQASVGVGGNFTRGQFSFCQFLKINEIIVQLTIPNLLLYVIENKCKG
jgi:hypothetical protein